MIRPGLSFSILGRYSRSSHFNSVAIEKKCDSEASSRFIVDAAAPSVCRFFLQRSTVKVLIASSRTGPKLRRQHSGGQLPWVRKPRLF
ncbi:MAG: hypothetical protein ACJ8AH_22575 [Stellaceae bacterium]